MRGRQENGTSITTIASEYTSDFIVGRASLSFSSSFAFRDNARSSGARQRVEPLPVAVEAWNEKVFLVIDDNPKSVKRGFPLGSIRIFDCVSNSAGSRKGRSNAYAL